MNLEDFQKWMKNRLTWQLVMTGMILATIGAIELILWVRKPKSSPSLSSSPASSGKICYALAEDKKSISPTFARAFYFKIDDKIYENPYREAIPAGPPAADYVASLGAKTVVAGGFGPNASGRLRELGVTPKIYG